MKTKTNRRVKRSKTTRRTRRKLRNMKGGVIGIIDKGRKWLEWRNRRKEAMDKIDNDYWECKLECEMNRNRKLREVKEQYDKEWATTASQASSTKVLPEPIKVQVPTIDPVKEEYDKSGAAIQVAEYKKSNLDTYTDAINSDLVPKDMHSVYAFSPLTEKDEKTANGWYVDLSNPDSSTIRNIHDETISIKTVGLRNLYEFYINKLPNPSFTYKSSIPSSPEYTLVQKDKNELVWKNLSTEKLIPFSTHRPLLINDNGREIVLQPKNNGSAEAVV